MRIFEPHAHMHSRVTDDYERMALAGIKAVLEPAFWIGQPRTSAATFADYFDAILGWETFRAAQYGIRHYVTLALNPKEANDDRVNDAVIELLPRYLEKDGVLGVGEIGYDDQTEREERFFRLQLELAKEQELPVLIHTPHRDKVRGVERTLALLDKTRFPLGRALIDHNTEETVGLVAPTGAWMAFSIYPDTKMDEDRVCRVFERHGTERMLVNSAADWGKSDPLKVPRTALEMRRRGFAERDIARVVWDNPVAFFAQSGRLDPRELNAPFARPGAETYEGSSILRGPRV